MNELEVIENKDVSEDRELTERQKKYVDFRIDGHDKTNAARLAGFANPNQSAWIVENKPHVAAAIRKRMFYKLQTHGAERAINYLVKTIDDEKAPHAVRYQCAKAVLEKTKDMNDKAIQDSGPINKQLADMDIPELEAFIRQAMDAQDRKIDALPEVKPDNQG